MRLTLQCPPVAEAHRGQIKHKSAASRSHVFSAARQTRPTLRPVAATTADDRGLSGFDVDGNRPTSPKAWEIMIDTMRRNRVAMINASQLQIAQAAGTPIIDVRPAGQYEAGFIQGSINVPLYQPIEGWEQRKILRRLGFALFGVFNGTEINPNFMQQLQEAAPDMEAGAVLICNLGGSMAPMGEHKKGQQSRSLFAAYELTRAGYKNIKVLEGGFNAWRGDGRDVYYMES